MAVIWIQLRGGSSWLLSAGDVPLNSLLIRARRRLLPPLGSLRGLGSHTGRLLTEETRFPPGQDKRDKLT